jgi:hypothetical protein
MSVYVSGTSPVMVKHLKEYAEQAVQSTGSIRGGLVFEFGSNDGTLLGHFKEMGYQVLDMDPAINLAQEATSRGLPTIPVFFGAESAKKLAIEHGKAQLICANHCCAHIDDIRGVIQGELLAPEGIWVFEVGYLLSVFQNNLFDTIYHKHVDFHSVAPIQNVCECFGLKLLNAETNSIQGGSLRCFVGWPNTCLQKQSSHIPQMGTFFSFYFAQLNHIRTKPSVLIYRYPNVRHSHSLHRSVVLATKYLLFSQD